MAFAMQPRKRSPCFSSCDRIEVSVPHEYTRDIMGNLASRRGHIESQEDREGIQIIYALVPLAELFGYASDLRSRTHGRGTFAMQFALYQPCDPPEDNDHGNDSMVGVPRKPMPTRRDSSVALPEPVEDDRGD
jgi:translation elongation factor EF-G